MYLILYHPNNYNHDELVSCYADTIQDAELIMRRRPGSRAFKLDALPEVTNIIATYQEVTKETE